MPILNCAFSFIAGFAVWPIVGYLEKLGKLEDGNYAAINLAFITYPTAIDGLTAPNFWAIILGFTLFTLGIDSAFCVIESLVATVHETTWGKDIPKICLSAAFCIGGCICSLPFCFNFGFWLWDIVDHYQCCYLFLVVGVLQSYAAGWRFDEDTTKAKSTEYAKSMNVLKYGYWLGLILISCLSIFLGNTVLGIVLFPLIFLFIIVPAAYFFSETTLGQFAEDILMSGIRKISYSFSKLGRAGDRKDKEDWEWWFMVIWGTLIKFIDPFLLIFIIVSLFKDDIEEPYGKYSAGWQVVGWLVPGIGVLIYVFFLFFDGESEDYDLAEFEIDAPVPQEDDKPADEIEFAKVNPVNLEGG